MRILKRKFGSWNRIKITFLEHGVATKHALFVRLHDNALNAYQDCENKEGHK